MTSKELSGPIVGLKLDYDARPLALDAYDQLAWLVGKATLAGWEVAEHPLHVSCELDRPEGLCEVLLSVEDGALIFEVGNE